MTKKEVNAILEYVLEVKKQIFRHIESSKKEEEIIQKVKELKPRGQFGVFIHDDTIIKWYKFWKKSHKAV